MQSFLAGPPLIFVPNPNEGDLVPGASTSRVAAKLYVGSKPPPRTRLHPPFDILVLCAREHQRVGDYPDVAVMGVPLDDSGPPITHEEAKRALVAAYTLARMLRGGRRVLVTCAQGVNRSSLVAALALRFRDNLPGRVAMMQIKTARPQTFTNRSFVAFLNNLPTPGLLR